MKRIIAVICLLTTALPFAARANDTASATIFISVFIHPQSSIESLVEAGDVCGSLLTEDPEAFVATGCDLVANHYEVSQEDELLRVEPI